jgi:hypothetical protein
LHGWKVSQQQRRLVFGRSLSAESEEDKRRAGFALQTEHCTEIGVGRYQNAIFAQCAVKYRLVGFGLHRVIAHMYRVVPGQSKCFGDNRREGVIDQKSHGIVKGSSRSRTASAA